MVLPLCLSLVLTAGGCQVDSTSATLAAAAVPGAQASTLLAANDGAAPNASGASASSCGALPPMPALPAKTRSVAEFGVKPSDTVDNTDGIQRALDSLKPGEWLVFPPGRYLHSKRLRVKVPNTVLWGDGATLDATNPDDMAVMLEADGASIYKFTLTGVTDKRRSAPWQSRIAVFGGADSARLLSNNIVRGNRVVHAGDPGSQRANSSGSAAIFMYHAANFLVAENTVSRSLSDGIHVTGGSSYGRVLNNTVTETGDDMIAVVSYIGDPSQSAQQVAGEYDARRAKGLSHHILIANNTVSGQYWGRGISVVGGENVTIENNTIDKPSHGAAIYLARETSYLTFGVRNILVRNNTITDVQTTAPNYVAGTVSASANKTGHGAIEIYSWLFTDEADNAALRNALAVQNIRIESNTISRARGDGVRIGSGYGKTWSWTGKNKKDGSSFTRAITGGPVGLISLAGNKMGSLGGKPIAINNAPTPEYNIACSNNTAEGKSASAPQCEGNPPPIEPACPL
jgi:parallel beta-helix repeat protein